MKRALNTLFFSLLLAAGLLSCTDHRLGGPVSPARLRLRSLESVTPVSSANYKYTYGYEPPYGIDSENRPTSIDRINGGVSSQVLIFYGEPIPIYSSRSPEPGTIYVEFPNPADRSIRTVTRYPFLVPRPDLGAPAVFGFKYGVGPDGRLNENKVLRAFNYDYDGGPMLKNYYESSNTDTTDRIVIAYTATNYNITAEKYSYMAGRGDTGSATYTYDANPNPLFGFLDPATGPIQFATRNNMLSRTNMSNRGINSGVTTYSYTYNSQKLPTQRVATYNGAVIETLTYAYEPY